MYTETIVRRWLLDLERGFGSLLVFTGDSEDSVLGSRVNAQAAAAPRYRQGRVSRGGGARHSARAGNVRRALEFAASSVRTRRARSDAPGPVLFTRIAGVWSTGAGVWSRVAPPKSTVAPPGNTVAPPGSRVAGLWSKVAGLWGGPRCRKTVPECRRTSLECPRRSRTLPCGIFCRHCRMAGGRKMTDGPGLKTVPRRGEGSGRGARLCRPRPAAAA